MSSLTILNNGGKDSNFTIRKEGLTNAESANTMTNLISKQNRKCLLLHFDSLRLFCLIPIIPLRLLK